MQREARLHESAGDIYRHRSERVIADQRAAVEAEQAADYAGELCLLGGDAYEQRSGRVKPGPDMGSSSVTGWEEFGRSHLARTVPNLSQPS